MYKPVLQRNNIPDSAEPALLQGINISYVLLDIHPIRGNICYTLPSEARGEVLTYKITALAHRQEIPETLTFDTRGLFQSRLDKPEPSQSDCGDPDEQSDICDKSERLRVATRARLSVPVP